MNFIKICKFKNTYKISETIAEDEEDRFSIAI